MAKIQGLSATKDEKKKPVKAQPNKNSVGGIFVAKIAAIWKKMFGR